MPEQVNAVLNRIMLSFPDPKTLKDELDLVSEDDDALAEAPAGRLGITLEDAVTLRQARNGNIKILDAWAKAIEAGELLDENTHYVDLAGAANGSDGQSVTNTSATRPPPPPPPRPAPQSPAQKVSSPPPPPPPPPPQSAPAVNVGAAPPTKSGRGKKTRSAAGTPPPDHISKEVLQSIKDHAGLKDELLAEIMGISRPTLANIMKGKVFYTPPDVSRRKALHDTVMKHSRALMEMANKIIPL